MIGGSRLLLLNHLIWSYYPTIRFTFSSGNC